MMGRRFALLAGAAMGAVVGVVLLVGSGLLNPPIAQLVDDGAQLATGTGAAVACWWTARHRTGVDRRWRRYMCAAMAGWTVGMVFWAWYRNIAHTPLPSPSLADVGFFMLPVFALPALLSFAIGGVARDRDETPGAATRARAVLVLDGLIVTGSLFLLTWTTTLGAVVAAGAPSPLAFVVAVGYPVTDLVLVTIVVMLASLRRASQPRQLLLLGLGLVALAVSDSIFAYLVSSGAEEMHLVSDAGFIAGPTLIFLAAMASDDGRTNSHEPRWARQVGWLQLGLPYLPLLIAGGWVVVFTFIGDPLDSTEGLGLFLIVALVVVRQLLTLVDNTALLTRVRQAQQRLAYQASHDPLTGLANNRVFEEQLTDLVALHRVDRRPFALLYLDLDDFKAINDEFGHRAGDALLQAVAGRLRGCIRDHGGDRTLVARLGGDEFAILLEGDRTVSGLVRERVIGVLRRPFAIAGKLRDVHGSVGLVAVDPHDDGVSPTALLNRADAAMYSAKRRHKYGLRKPGPGIFVSSAADADMRGQLAAALRPDAGWPGLDVHYQPIVRVADHQVVAVEALARWTSPSFGVVTPDAFVALAEQGGLVADLDNFVLNRACREVTTLTPRLSTPLTLHVNVSASRLADPELVDGIRAALRRHAIDGERLVLEITETCHVPDFDAARGIIDELRRYGIRFALDDFGTGYNTLAHLHRLPVDMVKLDQTFTTSDARHDPTRTNALRRSIVSIARALDVMIVVEGVETKAQDSELARHGYDFAQGYFYGRPAPLSQLPLSLPTSVRG